MWGSTCVENLLTMNYESGNGSWFHPLFQVMNDICCIKYQTVMYVWRVCRNDSGGRALCFARSCLANNHIILLFAFVYILCVLQWIQFLSDYAATVWSMNAYDKHWPSQITLIVQFGSTHSDPALLINQLKNNYVFL